MIPEAPLLLAPGLNVQGGPVSPTHPGLSRAASPSLLAHPVLDLQVREPHPLALTQGHHRAFNGLRGKGVFWFRPLLARNPPGLEGT